MGEDIILNRYQITGAVSYVLCLVQPWPPSSTSRALLGVSAVLRSFPIKKKRNKTKQKKKTKKNKKKSNKTKFTERNNEYVTFSKEKNRRVQ